MNTHVTSSMYSLFADGDVCFTHVCTNNFVQLFCFPKGDIIGSMMIWLDTPVRELKPSKRRRYNLYNPIKGLHS